MGAKVRNIIASNRSGMSLVEILVGVGISGVVIVSVLQLTRSTTSAGDRAYIQSLIDNAHMSGLHYARSPDAMRRLLADSSLNPLPAAYTELERCLGGKGSNCTQFQVAAVALKDKSGDLNTKYGRTGGKCTGTNGDCIIKRSTTYRILCSKATSCEAVEVNVKSFYEGPSVGHLKFADREATVSTPGFALVSHGKISFSCADPHFVTGVDYETMDARCENVNTITHTLQCADGKPLALFGGSLTAAHCAQMESVNCQYGLSQVGVFQSQSTCRSVP